MRHVPRRAAALALVALLLAPPLAAAEASYGLGELLAPGFGFADGLLGVGDSLVAPGAPMHPVAPLLLPALELGRTVLDVSRALAGATVVGARDGDAGASLGWPDQVGAGVRERTVVDGVVVPGHSVVVPERQVPVGTPGLDRTIVVPPIVLPSQTVRTPDARVTVAVPPVSTPPAAVATPGVDLTVPAVRTPPLYVTTPPVVVGPQHVAADISGADVQVQELHGTLYVGPAAVPYTVGPLRAGASDLPPEVPRSIAHSTPPVQVLPSQTVVQEPSRTLLPEQRIVVPAQEVASVEGREVFAGAVLAEVAVPAQQVQTPPVRVFDGRTERVVVPAQHVGTVILPGQRVDTPTVVVTDERVVVPGMGRSLQPPPGLPEVGYVGYGQVDDSSLYPFACTAFVGCVEGRHRLKPYVDAADAYADALAGTVDRGVVLAV